MRTTRELARRGSRRPVPPATQGPAHPIEVLQAGAGNRAVAAAVAGAASTQVLRQPGSPAVVQRRIATWLTANGGAASQAAAGTPAFGVTTSLHGTAGKPLIDMPTVTAGRRIHVHLEPQLPLDLTEISGWNVKDVVANQHLHVDNTRSEIDAEDRALFTRFASGWTDLTRYAGRRDIHWGAVPRQRREAILGQHQAARQQLLQDKRDAQAAKRRDKRAGWIGRRDGSDQPRSQEFNLPATYVTRGKKTLGPWGEAISTKLGKDLTLPTGVTVDRVQPPQGKGGGVIVVKLCYADYRTYTAEQASVAAAVMNLMEGTVASTDHWQAWIAVQALEHEAYLAEVRNGDHDVDLGIY